MEGSIKCLHVINRLIIKQQRINALRVELIILDSGVQTFRIFLNKYHTSHIYLEVTSTRYPFKEDVECGLQHYIIYLTTLQSSAIRTRCKLETEKK